MNEITITKHEGGFRLKTEQRFPLPAADVFPFFADAGNLQAITPANLHFQILTEMPIEMRPGAVIDYKIRLRGFPIHWQTEITAWEPTYRFVDRQLKGPYKWWIHEHLFEERDGETVAIDIVDYGVPLAFIAHPLLVKNDLIKIFRFRHEVLAKRFGEVSCATG
jgi:ligand-binding SRPBCC domain-containing protein